MTITVSVFGVTDRSASLGIRIKAAYPADGVTLDVNERIYAEILLQRLCPWQTLRLASSMLAQKVENAIVQSSLGARCE